MLNTQLGFRFSSDNTLGTSDVQLMGMSGRNVKILLDGIPMADRGDTRESLGQVDVNSIDRIEIVEGPMSVSYGSDALAGEVNIITERPQQTKGNFFTRYGSNNTSDLSADYSTTIGKVGIYAFIDRYSTGGYDLSPENFGNTVSPFTNYTASTKVTWKIGPKTDFVVKLLLFIKVSPCQAKVSFGADLPCHFGAGRVVSER